MADEGGLPEWHGVTVRPLANWASGIPRAAVEGPLVVQARQSRSVAFLKTLLSDRAVDCAGVISRHGAMVLRGFDIHSEADFQETLRSVHGFRPMRSYFMEEPGRELIGGSEDVFYTNRLHPTGGGLQRAQFHSEGYRSPDVPAILSFWCKTSPWWGGETALVHMADVFAELDECMQEKFMRESFLAKNWRLTEIAERYGLSDEETEAFCRGVGLSVVTEAGIKYVFLFKPSVMVHPRTRRRSLQINMAAELKVLGAAFRPLFATRYAAARWAVHRFAWEHPRVRNALRSPTAVLHRIWRGRQRHATVHPGTRAPELETGLRMGSRFPVGDVQQLAASMWRHCSMIDWRRGDVAIIDNGLIAHAGLPGFGRRELRVILGNPIPMRHPIVSGLFEGDSDLEDGYESFDIRLRQFAMCHATKNENNRAPRS